MQFKYDTGSQMSEVSNYLMHSNIAVLNLLNRDCRNWTKFDLSLQLFELMQKSLFNSILYNWFKHVLYWRKTDSCLSEANLGRCISIHLYNPQNAFTRKAQQN